MTVAKARSLAGFAELPDIPEKVDAAQKKGDDKLAEYSAANDDQPSLTEVYDKEICEVYQKNVAKQVASDFLKGIYERSSEKAVRQAKASARCKKDKFNKALEELQVVKTGRDVIEHLCMGTA